MSRLTISQHQGFEVNTDAAFVNPDWEFFPLLHEQRYGLAIDYIKSMVEGVSYANNAMELVVGENGFYAEATNFPAAFYGGFSPAKLHYISELEAQEIVWEALALYRAGDVKSITCVYSEEIGPADVFFGYRYDVDGELHLWEMGRYRDTLPLHLRVMLDNQSPSDLLDRRAGVLIYQRTADGRHLLLKSFGECQPFPLIDGFDA